MSNRAWLGLGISVVSGLVSFGIHFIRGDGRKALFGLTCFAAALVGTLVAIFS